MYHIYPYLPFGFLFCVKVAKILGFGSLPGMILYLVQYLLRKKRFRKIIHLREKEAKSYEIHVSSGWKSDVQISVPYALQDNPLNP